jgi:L-seryl-tRNA(Ser) seleniumtransferase
VKIYERLGVRRIVNAEAELTRLGGSLMPPPVLQAMKEAADSFCDLHELQRACGERLASLTRNEGAYICNGAASGLFLATLGCITRGDLHRIARLPALTGMRDEVVLFGAQRNPYDLAVRQTGVRVVQVGNPSQTFDWELEAALSERTAAVLFFANGVGRRGELPLEQTIAIAHAAGVPVIVDGAAQVPPAENLWRYTRDAGADLAVFSGGKGLRGPQSSGLIVGGRELIEACRALGAPHQRIGRPMKVGKEEMCGLLAAVEWFLSLDHDARLAEYERVVARVVESVQSLPGVTASRTFPGVAGQPLPRALVRIDPAHARTTRDDALQALWEGDPRIALTAAGDDGFYVNPHYLSAEDASLVVARLEEVLTS